MSRYFTPADEQQLQEYLRSQSVASPHFCRGCETREVLAHAAMDKLDHETRLRKRAERGQWACMAVGASLGTLLGMVLMRGMEMLWR